MQQSVSLLHVKDPLFKRMGASRLARFAIDGNFNFSMLLISVFFKKPHSLLLYQQSVNLCFFGFIFKLVMCMCECYMSYVISCAG